VTIESDLGGLHRVGEFAGRGVDSHDGGLRGGEPTGKRLAQRRLERKRGAAVGHHVLGARDGSLPVEREGLGAQLLRESRARAMYGRGDARRKESTFYMAAYGHYASTHERLVSVAANGFRVTCLKIRTGEKSEGQVLNGFEIREFDVPKDQGENPAVSPVRDLFGAAVVWIRAPQLLGQWRLVKGRLASRIRQA